MKERKKEEKKDREKKKATNTHGINEWIPCRMKVFFIWCSFLYHTFIFVVVSSILFHLRCSLAGVYTYISFVSLVSPSISMSPIALCTCHHHTFLSHSHLQLCMYIPFHSIYIGSSLAHGIIQKLCLNRIEK